MGSRQAERKRLRKQGKKYRPRGLHNEQTSSPPAAPGRKIHVSCEDKTPGKLELPGVYSNAKGLLLGLRFSHWISANSRAFAVLLIPTGRSFVTSLSNRGSTALLQST